MRKIILSLMCLGLFSCQDEHSKLPDGLYADIETVKGHIVVKLEFEKAPITVANFVTLAEGKNPYVSANLKGKPFYDGLKFHRVEPGFVIQGGDPEGNGSGGPGYKFIDEITDLTHNRAGTLSMANSGPKTNGSQFFITLSDTPYLDGKHTVFGYVVENGMEAVNKIVKDDGMISVKIVRKGEAAKKFDAVKVFSDYFAKEAAAMARKKAYFDAMKGNVKTAASGLQYKIISNGSGKKPAAGTMVFVNYAGYFANGRVLDTNIEAAAKEAGTYDKTRKMQRGYTPMPFQYGTKPRLIPGFIEAIELMSYGDKTVFFIPYTLGYGEAGSPDGFIPPNSDLIFELELLEKPLK